MYFEGSASGNVKRRSKLPGVVKDRAAGYMIAGIGEPNGTFGFHAMTLRVLVLVLGISLPAVAQTKPRARELGVPLEGTPGPFNAITDVPGVEVGHRSLISGTSVRTGVTVVWPRG